MSIHIGAESGTIAPFVLVPGDPLRAKRIAETYFDNCVLHSSVRNMLGYTGSYKGKPVSTQGTGMGMPSFSIYITELVNFYKAKVIIRIGTAGALHAELTPGTIIISDGSVTDSNMNNIRFGEDSILTPQPDLKIFKHAVRVASNNNFPFAVGKLFSSDFFYDPVFDFKDYSLKMFAEDKSVLAVEMETHELYTLGLLLGFKALSICTISDNLVTGERMNAEERVDSFKSATEIALSLL